MHRSIKCLACERVAWLAVAVALAACQSSTKPFAEARVIESLDQAIGGPTANARVNDLLLINDQIKVVIEQGDVSYHPTDVGGSIIDIDLNRPEREFRAGKGLDQLGQIAPIANLSVAKAIGQNDVRITRSAAGAEVTTAVAAGPVYRILEALNALLQQEFVDGLPSPRMYNEYELRPGERLLRITTTIGFDVDFCPVDESDGCNAECDDALYDDDCECAQVPAGCQTGVVVRDAEPLPDRDVSSILDTALGDLPRPLGTGTCDEDADCDMAAGETCVGVTSMLGGEFRVCRSAANRDGGVFLGDLLIFGGNVTQFIRNIVYETETDIRRLFDQGGDTLAQPLNVDGVFATGDRVSYGYGSPSGTIQVPIFSGPFSMGATHAASCASGDTGCLSGVLLRFERWVSVGTGDVASAQEPIARAQNRPLGTVQGLVTESPSNDPLPDISVYALADPRALPCDGACEAACPLTGEPETWSLEQLRDANRCRTRQPPNFPEGTAAIETFALTDPGTDPIRDGRFKMTLPPGDYMLIAVDGTRARSALVPVTVSDGSTTNTLLTLPESGKLDYMIFDERGDPIAGKVIVGQCLPGAPCSSDGDCASGDLCQAAQCACPWTTLLPVELGGSRPQDGVLATQYTIDGSGRIELPAGDYEIIFAHGPHYSIDRQRVTITPRVGTQVRGFVHKQVDRQDWVSADFHVHATNSMDSGIPNKQRVVAFLAEDMDFLSSSDHDWLTRYQYLIEDLGVSDELGSQVGAEITTQEYGHFIAFPLRYQAWEDGERKPSNGAVQWRSAPPQLSLSPQEIMNAARELSVDGLPVLIDIPHPYDYFDYYQLNPITLEPTPSLLNVINQLLDPSFFSGDFDAMELVNARAYYRIRRATVGEIRAFSTGLDDLVTRLQSGEITQADYDRQIYDLSMENIRQRIHRTAEEQQAILAGEGGMGDVACYCGSQGDCAPGLVCEPSTMRCVLPPASTDPAPPDRALCARFRGVIDDWFNMLNRGVVRTGVSGSDVHGGATGNMRTFLRTGGTTPPNLKQDDIVAAISNGQAVVSNGPMVHFTIDGQHLGDTVATSSGQAVTLSIRVEKADWYDVDRIEIYRNGELIHWARGCESTRGEDDPHDHPCIPTGDGVVVAWDEDLQDTPERDSWYVVLAYGIDGRTMAPLYGSVVLASIGVPEITQRIYDIIPTLREFRNPRFPSQHPLFPFAFTNPIWVDVGNDGWEPSLEPPSWCRPGDYGC